MSEDKKELATAEQAKGQTAMAVASEVPMGFENEEAGDMIIPRIKVIQTLSPERKDKSAEEGDIINSLTKEKLNGKTFIPVYKFNNHITWRDRADGGGIECIAKDGKMGTASDGTNKICAACKRCEFDNTKSGKEAAPSCTKYINFFGFIVGDNIPIILSFAKTNYNEGKKLYSLAKVTMQNMFNHGYTLTEKLVAKNSNEWYIINIAPAGPTSPEDRAFAIDLFKSFSNLNVNYDMEEAVDSSSPAGPVDISKAEC